MLLGADGALETVQAAGLGAVFMHVGVVALGGNVEAQGLRASCSTERPSKPFQVGPRRAHMDDAGRALLTTGTGDLVRQIVVCGLFGLHGAGGKGSSSSRRPWVSRTW